MLEAILRPKQILECAKNLGCPAAALTDTGVGHGLIEFYEASEKTEGVKPILGAEIFIARDSRFERRAGIDGREGYIVALARTNRGYSHLMKLISESQLTGLYVRPRVDKELLQTCHEGLTVLTGGTQGYIGQVFLEHGEAKAREALGTLQDIFGKEYVFLELMSRNNEETKELNTFFVQLNKEGIAPCVITNNARYATPDDEEACNTLYAIGQNDRTAQGAKLSIIAGSYFKSFEEMAQELGYIPEEILEEARQNTLAIAESVSTSIEFGNYMFPTFELPEGTTPAQQLRTLCEQAIPARYGSSPNPEIQKRLDYELSVIGSMGFDAYFLIVADFVAYAKKNDIAVGPGRGSAAGSIVSYLLDITTIDPLRYGLLFERFLNPERVSMPDIDIDFSDERRDEVIGYVIDKYGAEKVSRVCTFGTMAAKAALKDVGRVNGIPFAEMNALTKTLPNRPGFSLSDAEQMKEVQSLLTEKPHLKNIFALAKRLEGCVRHVSVHACAVIIGADDLSRTIPVQWAPGSEDIKITQYPFQQLDHLGILKMDFLGLKNLSVLEKTILNIRSTTGEDIVLADIPIDDAKTFEMLSRGETTGVFQFESAGMRRYLKELGPTELEDLIAMAALYRPGPMDSIPDYIRGKNKPEEVQYEVPELKPFLERTYGVIVYQEQVQRVVQEFAGFSLGAGYLLIKAVGKKIPALLQEQKQKFMDGAQEKGYSKALAEKIFNLIEPFSGYGFNKSHSTCYARIAYETAYMRANYPVQFMAAMMTTDSSNTDRIKLEMSECRTMGIEVLPPSVNQSGGSFTIIPVEGSTQQVSLNEGDDEKPLHNFMIRFGLTAIKGLGEETVEQIIIERNKNGAFASLQDFARRVPVRLLNKKTLEALAFSGAFDMFGDRKAIVDSLDDLSRFAKEEQEKALSGQMGLFGGEGEKAIEFTLQDTKATKEDILRWEREILGLFVSDHPLKGLGGYFEKYGHLIGTLAAAEDAGQKRTLHGLVTGVRRMVTKRGQNMAIVQMEDTSGGMEVAIFPAVYPDIPEAAMEVDSFIKVKGRIEERDGALTMIADEISVGNLSDIQQSGWAKERNPDEPDAPAATPKKPSKTASKQDETQSSSRYTRTDTHFLTIHLPEGVTRKTVTDLRALLDVCQNPTGKRVSLCMEGKYHPLPFRVDVSDQLVQDIDHLLSCTQ